jgi:uncharacterized repeat protein (TIGR03803 family)
MTFPLFPALRRLFPRSFESGVRCCEVAVLATLLTLPAARAQTTTLHTFTGGGNDGARPSSPLVQAADGTIYGVTAQGGTNNNGTVFRMRPDGSGYQVIFSFPTGAGAPIGPGHSLLLGRDGALFGTSEFGGSAVAGGPGAFGTLYRLNTDGSGFAVLRTFTAGGPTVVNDAGAPRGGLVQADDGFLYGCATTGTATGTTTADRGGVIYRIAPDGSDYRLIFSFQGGVGSSTGVAPNSLTLGNDGMLYGTALGGPAAGGGTGGTVFTLRTDGTGFAVLKTFGNSINSSIQSPESQLIHASDGYLYGTTRSGGTTGDGAIYRLLPNGTGFEIIHFFLDTAPARGLEPRGAFFMGRDGALCGRTSLGGTNNFGVLYKVRTDGSGFRVLANFTTARTGYFDAVLQGLDGAIYATTENTVIRVLEAPGLQITQQPRSQTIAPGGSVTFTVSAPGATTYQWRRNGTNIAGATASNYTLSNLTSAADATYTVVAANSTDAVTSNGAILLVATPIPGRLINLSVRTTAGSGAETLIAGFVVGGTGSKQVLVRAIGPTLNVFGVTGVLDDPQLGLFNASSAQMASNTSWGGTAVLSAAFAQVGAFALGSASRDAALLTPLSAGGYSAQVVSASGGTGVALVEAYDVDNAVSTSRFVNLSARTAAGTGAQTLIAGFVLSGNVPRTFLIRGIGPTLADFGVAGALANPRLELHTTINDRDTTVASNSGWGGTAALSAAFAQVGAFALPAASADAALLVTLTPGNTTGVALVEVYEVP